MRAAAWVVLVVLAAIVTAGATTASDRAEASPSRASYAYDRSATGSAVVLEDAADGSRDEDVRGRDCLRAASSCGYDDSAHLARASAHPDRYGSAPRSVADDLVGAACSFSAATTVVMADGTRKAISEIEVGDYVLAEDPETGERGPRRVTHVWEHEDTVVDLEIDGDLVTTTADHPFWNATDSEWQEAQELDADDRVRTADGELVEVAGLRLRTARTTTAFNLTVDGIHTYFVGIGEDDVLVHNTCGPSISGRMGAAGPGDEFGLPGQGRIRYVPPRGYNPANPLPRGQQGGYVDRFGNEWVVGPSRTPGHPFEWDVQLSRTGREQIGWLSRDGAHVNVSPLGEVTHL